MNILEALNKIGVDNIQFQSLAQSMTNGRVGKKQSTITFATQPDIVSDLNKKMVLGGMPNKVGLVLWIDSTKWQEAVK